MSRPTKDDQPERVSLSTRDLEDDLAYSTYSGRTPDRSRRKYESVDHALCWLAHFIHVGAIDLEMLALPTSTSADHDHYLIEQCHVSRLAGAFNAALREAGDRDARIWGGVRLEHRTHRSFKKVSRSQVGRIVGEVDGLIALSLKKRHMWRAGAITPEEHAVEPRRGKEEMA